MNAEKKSVKAIIRITLMVCMIIPAMGVTAQKADRDKIGTNGANQKNRCSQVARNTQLTNLSSFQAERQGFEPWVPLRAHWFSRPAQSATLSPLREGSPVGRIILSNVNRFQT